jgi:hypothetical protein
LTAFRDINRGDSAEMGIKQDNPQHFLPEGLHIDTGAIDRLRDYRKVLDKHPELLRGPIQLKRQRGGRLSGLS